MKIWNGKWEEEGFGAGQWPEGALTRAAHTMHCTAHIHSAVTRGAHTGCSVQCTDTGCTSTHDVLLHHCRLYCLMHKFCHNAHDAVKAINFKMLHCTVSMEQEQ